MCRDIPHSNQLCNKFCEHRIVELCEYKKHTSMHTIVFLPMPSCTACIIRCDVCVSIFVCVFFRGFSWFWRSAPARSSLVVFGPPFVCNLSVFVLICLFFVFIFRASPSSPSFVPFPPSIATAVVLSLSITGQMRRIASCCMLVRRGQS